MCATLYQVTNQMVSACKQYISERGHTRVFDVEFDVLLERINTCQQLHLRYQEYFRLGTQKVQQGTKPLEISEMYIFGKFTSFCRRLECIEDIVKVS